MLSASTASRSRTAAQALDLASRLTWLERAALFVGIFEIPLQFDKYFGYRDADAMLGALGGLNISITTLALFVLYGIWLADTALHRRRSILRPLFGIPMLVYLAINLVSAAGAAVPMLSFFDFALLAQAYALFFYLANRIQTLQDVLFCLLTFAAAFVTQSLLMLIAAALHLEDEAISFGPLMLAVYAGQRHVGTMRSPILAGSTLAMLWFPVATSLVFIRNKWAWRMVFVCTGAGLLAILMTQSRGAILTVCLGSLIIAVGLLSRGWLPKWTIIVALVLALISLYPLGTLYQNRIKYGDEESAASRVHLSLIAIQAISEHPLLGYGAGNCHLATQKFADQSSYRAEWFYTVHCKYLLVWVETGLAGLLAFLLVLGNGLRQGINVWRKRDPALSPLALALVAALAGHSLHMGVDIFNSRTQVQMLWCVLGLVAAVYKMSHQEAFRSSPALIRRGDMRQQSHGMRAITGVCTNSRQLDEGVF